MVKDCPNVRSQDKGNGEARPRDPSCEAPKKESFL